MRLTKKINNNVALGVDDAGVDVVVFGKGIGFHHMPYELVDTSDVLRVFHDVSTSLASQLGPISDSILLAASDIVELARMELECRLNPNLPFTLADHIQFAIERRAEGIDIQNPLSAEVAFVYPSELGVARTGVAMVNRRVKGAELPEEEAYAIALHLVNGELGGAGDESSIHLVMESARIISFAVKVIEDDAGIELDRESYAFQRFAAHFRYLVARLMRGGEVTPSKNSSLFEQVAQDFPEVFLSVRKIADHLQSEYAWSCSNEELLYLMMHVNRLVMSS